MKMKINDRIENRNRKEMKNNLHGNGNGPYSHGKKFPLTDAVLAYILLRKR